MLKNHTPYEHLMALYYWILLFTEMQKISGPLGLSMVPAIYKRGHGLDFGYKI